jgi:hypothetical protein
MDGPRPLTINWGSSGLKAGLYAVEQMNYAAGPA